MKIIDKFERAYQDWVWGAGFHNAVWLTDPQCDDPRPIPVNRVRFIYEMIFEAGPWIISGWVCRWRGHCLISEDWGGPESGGMAGHCDRCGFSFYHVLY